MLDGDEGPGVEAAGRLDAPDIDDGGVGSGEQSRGSGGDADPDHDGSPTTIVNGQRRPNEHLELVGHGVGTARVGTHLGEPSIPGHAIGQQPLHASSRIGLLEQWPRLA